MPCILNTAYVQEELDRRVLALSWRFVACDVGCDALRYLQDDQLKRGSRQQHVLFIGFTLRQAGHTFVELRQRSIILGVDDSSVRNRLRHVSPPMASKSTTACH